LICHGGQISRPARLRTNAEGVSLADGEAGMLVAGNKVGAR